MGVLILNIKIIDRKDNQVFSWFNKSVEIFSEKSKILCNCMKVTFRGLKDMTTALLLLSL